MADVEALLSVLRKRGVATAAELAKALRASQPTISRALRAASSHVLVLGRGPATRYAATKGLAVPIYRVERDGSVEELGRVHRISDGRTVVASAGREPRVHDGLPWYLEDARPQGYLGRLFGRTVASQLGIPPDPRLWTTDQALEVLSSRGDDLPGNLIVGDESYQRYARARLVAPPSVARAEYEAIIAAQSRDGIAGSSAAGEQPKLVCRTPPPIRHLLVKHSPPRSGGGTAKRWRQLLRCEQLALDVLREHGIAAARAEYVEVAGRAFLEVERFDRTTRGRIGVVSATNVDAELVGSGTWLGVARGLLGRGVLPAEDAARVELVELYGQLIANTDMHLGNLSFYTDDLEHFRLTPVYDMLPMALRPDGEIARSLPQLPPPRPDNRHLWLEAAVMASQFWRRVLALRSLHELHGPARAAIAQMLALRSLAAR